MNESIAKKFFFEMDDIFNEVDLRYFLYLGTLLGAIREQRFLPIDKDLDVAVFQEEFDEKLIELYRLFKKNQFIVKWKYHNAKAEKAGIKTGLKIYKYSIHCDICCFSKIKNWRYYPRDKVQELLVYPAKILENLKEIEFYGRKVKVPFHAEKILELSYGQDWKIPHKKFIAESGNLSKKLPKKGDELWWVK